MIEDALDSFVRDSKVGTEALAAYVTRKYLHCGRIRGIAKLYMVELGESPVKLTRSIDQSMFCLESMLQSMIV